MLETPPPPDRCWRVVGRAGRADVGVMSVRGRAVVVGGNPRTVARPPAGRCGLQGEVARGGVREFGVRGVEVARLIDPVESGELGVGLGPRGSRKKGSVGVKAVVSQGDRPDQIAARFVGYSVIGGGNGACDRADDGVGDLNLLYWIPQA